MGKHHNCMHRIPGNEAHSGHKPCCVGFTHPSNNACGLCMKFGSLCTNDHSEVGCRDRFKCMRGSCCECKPHKVGCSNSWDDCCKGFFCNYGGHCIPCVATGNPCHINCTINVYSVDTKLEIEAVVDCCEGVCSMLQKFLDVQGLYS